MTPLALKAGAALVVLVLAAGYGYRHGAASVQRRWDAQQLADRNAAEAQAEQQRQAARAAATQYEARRAAIARRAAEVSPEVRNALSASICPPLGASAPAVRLGDVLVGAPVVDRLRRAGADY